MFKLVSLRGNTAQFIKSPNYPLYLSNSLSQEAHDQPSCFFAKSPSHLENY